jgi:undecaprenyl-diphosphatase
VPELIKAFILGIVEGATEFLPVSSTGHLIVAADLLDFEGPSADTFAIFIQLGAILAVVWLYRVKLLHVVAGLRSDPKARRLALNLAIAFLPAAIVGLLTHDWITEHLFNPVTVALALIAGGLGILAVEHWKPPSVVADLDDIPLPKALGVGLAQVLALFPGVSRSGATIMGGIGIGLSRKAATEFSFFLAIPIMLAATEFDLFDSRGLLTAADVPVFAVGFFVSFVAAMVAVRGLLHFVSGHTFIPFAWYRILVGALLLALYWR